MRGGPSHRGGGHHGRGGGHHHHNKNNAALQSRPREEGVICSLKESFGFIYCADRAEEMFFHFSQVNRQDWPTQGDLHLNQEVSFVVGESQRRSHHNNHHQHQPEKLAAMDVRKCAQPIVWEYPVDSSGEPIVGAVTGKTEASDSNSNTPTVKRYQGIVEKPTSASHNMQSSDVRRQSNNTQNNPATVTDGNIRVLMQEQIVGEATSGKGSTSADEGTQQSDSTEAGLPNTTKLSADGPLIRFTARDYKPAVGGGGRSGSSRLFKGDLVEFDMVQERRSKFKYARNIVLLLSEKERLRQEQEQKMLQEATLEHGVITSLKGDYGFLKSNKRREEVFFHYSSIEMDATEGSEEGNVVLQEGQDMQFLVVTEEHKPTSTSSDKDKEGDAVPPRRISARQVKLQPRGSVQFHNIVAACRSGVVMHPPQPVDSGHSLEEHGKIRLREPVTVTVEDENGESIEKTIYHVFLHCQDAPGGSFSFRGGSSAATWVQEGDVLLFDVVQDFVDGTCHAGPTQYLTPETNSKDENTVPAVRLIQLAYAMRSEGVINTLKEAYGFLHFAERPVDVHFKLFQVLPDALQQDLRRNMGLEVGTDSSQLHLDVGTEVAFDLSVHGTIQSHHHNTGRHHRGGNKGGKDPSHERDNLKAQRILFLPPNTVFHQKVLGHEVVGTVAKMDPKQPFAGTVELQQVLHPMTLEERHPLVAKLIKTYMNDEQATEPLVFHDIQTTKEDEIVIDMIQLLAKGILSYKHVPLQDQHPGEPEHPGKLCLLKVGIHDTPDIHLHAASGPDTDGAMTTDEEDGAPRKNRKKKKKMKQIKSLRFDKGSLSAEFKRDAPPTVGDVVQLDVVQSRRSGAISIVNMRITSRRTPTVTPSDGLGGVDGKASKSDNNSNKVGHCEGIVLLQPTHTELKSHNSRLRHAHSNNSSGSGSRWENNSDDKEPDVPLTEQGCVLLTDDPNRLFGNSAGYQQFHFKNAALHGAIIHDEANHPKRGDLVSFSRVKGGKGIRDVRVISRDIANRVQGKLSRIQLKADATMGSAKLVVSSKESYDIFLSQVVGCELQVLKENDAVEAFLYKGELYGICRTADLYLASKLGGATPDKPKERPKLNLTVKKNRGGTIMAQSMMAKGPDGTTGFAPGWTTRISKFATNN